MSTEKIYNEGLIGRKLGMTQIFTDRGDCVPVTVVELGPCFVLNFKTESKEGYSAVQLGFSAKKQQRVTAAERGHFAKAGAGCFEAVQEVRCSSAELGWNELGKELTVAQVFKEGDFIDVSGVSIGKGFQGVIRRYGMKGQPATRGTHEDRRNIGSIGCRKSPGRVHKGKRMAGHVGNANVTIQNLKVVGIRPEQNVLLIRGAVPGARGGIVVVRRALKKKAA